MRLPSITMPVPETSTGACFAHGFSGSGRRTVANIFTIEFSIAAAVASLTISEVGIPAAADAFAGGGWIFCRIPPDEGGLMVGTAGAGMVGGAISLVSAAPSNSAMARNKDKESGRWRDECI